MTDVATLVQEGIAAVKSGRREQARELLMRAVELDDHNERAWLWLSGVAEGLEDQIICLENVLVINPANAAAERGLRLLRAKLPPPTPEPPTAEVERPIEAEAAELTGWTAYEDDVGAETDLEETVEPVNDLDPAGTVDSGEDVRSCIHCGAPNPATQDLCGYCGRPVEEEAIPGSMQAAPAPVVAEEETDEVRFVGDYDARPQGLMSLIASWIAALSFNRRGAYEHEIFSASAGRTVGGIVLGAVIIPMVISLVTIVLLASSVGLDWLAILPSLAAAPFVAIPAVLGLIIQFYLWSGGLYLIAWAVGGKASFTVHTHLLSVAYASSGLLGSFAFLIGGAVLATLTELPASGDLVDMGFASLIGLLILGLAVVLYTLAMNGQALSAAHRFSWLGGVGVMVLSSLFYSLLIVLAVMLLLLLTNFTLTDLSLPAAL